MIHKIAVVADVSLGYGSPQILSITKSLLEEFPAARGLIIEPDQLLHPLSARTFSRCNVKRIFTNTNIYSNQWKIEYIRKVAAEVNRFHPDIIVYVGSVMLCKIHDYLRYPKPISVIYFLEMPEMYSFGNAYQTILNNLDDYADILLHPEINRMNSCMSFFPKLNIPQYVVYNASKSFDPSEVVASNELNGRILYQGTISRESTFADYYFDAQVQKMPIDIYGAISGEESTKFELTQKFTSMLHNAQYFGYINSECLAQRRKYYSYGIISWNPINANFKFAAPNKLFEYIGSGVVPIAAPHPQCQYLIKKYNCGIVLHDWSFDSFFDGLQYAMLIYGTPIYETMRQNCLKAANEELNWDVQIAPVMKKLQELAANRTN